MAWFGSLDRRKDELIRLWKLLGVCLASSIMLVPAGQAQNVPRGSSILIFPKVVSDGTYDTVIEVANTSQALVPVACWYGPRTDSAERPGGLAFHIWLTGRQPTQWKASSGRRVDSNDTCRSSEVTRGDCGEAGFDPGRIPTVPGPEPFRGQLFCAEVDPSGAPVSGNHLLGQATIVDLRQTGISAYRAEGLKGFDRNNGDAQLCLGGDPRPGCPTGAEYQGCAEHFFLRHLAEGSADPFDGTTFGTSLAVVSCSLDLNDRAASPLVLGFLITNEFEETFSASTTLHGYGEIALSEVSTIFARDRIGSDAVQTEIRAVGASSGFLVLGETHTSSPDLEDPDLAVTYRVHRVGESESGDVLIQLTEGLGR